MNSIRTRLFLNISFLVIFFVFVSWALSTLFLKEFYIWHKKSSLVENGQAIAALYQTGTQEVSPELERFASHLGASIVITDKDGYLKYSSFERIAPKQTFDKPPRIPHFGDKDAGSSQRPQPPEPPRPIVLSQENIDGNSTIEMQQNPEQTINFMVLKRTLNNNDILFIMLPLAAVSESASYASEIMAFTGFLSILAGCGWAFVFARKFSVPLLELSSIAQSISQLDFSQKCNITSKDEVGKLGESINNLSCQLNKSISQLNHKNQQLLADVEKERSLDKLRKNFISSVSHELKTPISLILGYAEGLKENVAQNEESKNYYCSVIVDEAEKMDKLVRDLLNLSQIESGYFHLERADFDLSLLLDEIILKYRTMLLEKNITLQIDKDPAVLVNGDVLRVEQVIVNLLNNAIDHAENANLVRISVTQGKDTFRVSIYNTGKHIPEDSISNLWLSFYKVDKARTRDLGGYGLGLSVVRAIQELHGNAYGVQNVEGGVRFWFDLDRKV